MSDQPNVQELLAAAQRMSERVRVLREAMNNIASWGEGPVVTGAFDEPHAAMTARAALEATQ